MLALVVTNSSKMSLQELANAFADASRVDYPAHSKTYRADAHQLPGAQRYSVAARIQYGFSPAEWQQARDALHSALTEGLAIIPGQFFCIDFVEIGDDEAEGMHTIYVIHYIA